MIDGHTRFDDLPPAARDAVIKALGDGRPAALPSAAELIFAGYVERAKALVLAMRRRSDDPIASDVALLCMPMQMGSLAIVKLAAMYGVMADGIPAGALDGMVAENLTHSVPLSRAPTDAEREDAVRQAEADFWADATAVADIGPRTVLALFTTTPAELLAPRAVEWAMLTIAPELAPGRIGERARTAMLGYDPLQ